MSVESMQPLSRLRWRVADGAEVEPRLAAEEAPIALVHQATTTAVMMATPADLEDLGLGFSLSEGIVGSPADIQDVEVHHGADGVEVRLWLSGDCSEQLAARRRHLAGPTGCGLCGVESLAAAAKPARPIPATDFKVSPAALLDAMAGLDGAQPLGRATRAAHAAALWRPDGELVVREDVGRHNALDKLIGATCRRGGGARGVLLLTSRVSVEMVQKAAVLGAPVICAVSAPTALAVRTAQAAGLTLVGVARADGFEVFTRPDRIDLPTEMRASL
jgi:FdhD protein